MRIEIDVKGDLMDDHVTATQRTLVTGLLLKYDNNMTKAARAAGRNRTEFYRLVEKLGIDRKVVAATLAASSLRAGFEEDLAQIAAGFRT